MYPCSPLLFDDGGCVVCIPGAGCIGVYPIVLWWAPRPPAGTADYSSSFYSDANVEIYSCSGRHELWTSHHQPTSAAHWQQSGVKEYLFQTPALFQDWSLPSWQVRGQMASINSTIFIFFTKHKMLWGKNTLKCTKSFVLKLLTNIKFQSKWYIYCL